MAVEACVTKKMFDDDSSSDDGTPIVFRRRDVSRQNQLDSALKGLSTRLDKPPGKHLPDTSNSNDRASGNSKGKVIHASKPSSSKPIANHKSQTLSGKSSLRPLASSGKMSLLKSLLPTSTASLVSHPEKDATVKVEMSKIDATAKGEKPNKDATIKEEKRKRDMAVKEEKPKREIAIKEEKSSTSDSEDDKPLSFRLSIGMKNANQAIKGHDTSSKPSKGKSLDDSDDDKPLSSKFQLNPNTGVSSSKLYKLDVDKPLTSKPQQNGSIKRDSQQNNASVIPAKRFGTDAVSGHSSSKKLKPSSIPVPVKDKQVSKKSEHEDENDHIPISQRMKNSIPVKKSTPMKQTVTKVKSSLFNRDKKQMKKVNNKSKYSISSKAPPASGDGQKWSTLVHSGVIFPPSYEPHGVKMLYDGRPVDLTPEQEEVATMYAVMLDSDYVQKAKFNENFFNDWKKLLGKNHTIQALSKCDFTPIQQWHLREKEKKKQMTTEEKKALKEEKMKQEEKYMWAIVDGVKEKVGNFRVEPPGLFRGRGEHPKMGKLKKRIHPSDITINIGKDAPIPECHIPGAKWKDIKHDNTVTWLAFWNDPINPKEFKYVFLAASSTLKGQSDKEKYEKSRMLKDYIQGIRAAYTKDFASKDMTKRQIAVATYLIDRLALRAGNEKDDDEADTVGCCTLKVENVKPLPPNILEFDFLGKDSIRYYKQFEAEPLVYKAVEQFRKGKKGSDDLFDMLDTSKLNAHLKELMPGLTAKVFRTYNASITLDNMLVKAAEDGDAAHKVCGYLEANKEVAIICNHQRSVSKSHSAQMERLTEKINELKDALSELETDMVRAKKGKPPLKSPDGKRKRNLTPEAIEKKVVQTKAKIEKMERDMKTKEDMKEIALGTSRINYLDPRITVAWCKRNEVPIEKIFNKSLLAKFAWAMDADPSFRF